MDKKTIVHHQTSFRGRPASSLRFARCLLHQAQNLWGPTNNFGQIHQDNKIKDSQRIGHTVDTLFAAKGMIWAAFSPSNCSVMQQRCLSRIWTARTTALSRWLEVDFCSKNKNEIFWNTKSSKQLTYQLVFAHLERFSQTDSCHALFRPSSRSIVEFLPKQRVHKIGHPTYGPDWSALKITFWNFNRIMK